MHIPSTHDCRRLARQMGMMNHIWSHSVQVYRVAYCLTIHLRDHPSRPNPNLIQAAALLHDITKTRSFRTRENHADTGSRLLAGLGYPEVADIIRQHVRLDAYFAAEFPTAPEIVNYADKRVLHDKIVSLNERMAYITDKYARTEADSKRIERLWVDTLELEKRLFDFLPFSPEDLPLESNP